MKSEAEKSLSRIRQLLADWLESSEKARGPVAEMLRLLEPIDAYIRGQSSAQPYRKMNRHTIEMRRGEEVLVEHREGGSTPYRCPKHLYETVAKALVAKDAQVTFEEIMKRVSKGLEDAPEWQVRAILRFMLIARPMMLWRSRNKYRPHRRAKFEAEAKAAWNALAEAGRKRPTT